MTIIDAIRIIEFERELTSTPDVDEHIEAVQCLMDTGIIFHLQGSYQRLAQDMFEAGIVTIPESTPL